MSVQRNVFLVTVILYAIAIYAIDRLQETVPVVNNLVHPTNVALVTYYAPRSSEHHAVHFSGEDYSSLSKLTLTNLAEYCHTHGMPFFFRNRFLVDTGTKDPYWGKMDVVLYYLDMGYEWVIWTDIDVLFMNITRSIVKEWIQPANNYHVALVSECNDDSPKAFSAVRSGFIAFKNTPQAKKFLKHWRDSHNKFKGNWNPDQEALEHIVLESPWKDMVYITNPDGIHTYPKCYEKYDNEALSVHFPGFDKGLILEYFNKLKTTQTDFRILHQDAA